MSSTSKELLLVFTRNPELGKCKTRLAAKVGDQAALDIYTFLLRHTVEITAPLPMDIWVCYSEKIVEPDFWSTERYDKKLQQGNDLGLRMMHLFQEGFDAGYEKIGVIGSDMYHLNSQDLNAAFGLLTTYDYVLGPAEDGGYYFLGMKQFKKELFQDKVWGEDSVLLDSLNDLKKDTYTLLPTRNDVDYYEDIKDIEAFQPFLKHLGE
jgi:rSAM/selenodomain-associated transferase 1